MQFYSKLFFFVNDEFGWKTDFVQSIIWVPVWNIYTLLCSIACTLYISRQWTHENLSKDEAQQKGIEILIDQIENVSVEKKEMIIMGDANLCSAKWKDPKFLHRKIANQLIGCLEHCDLTQGDVGVTFESDHVQAIGQTSSSSLLKTKQIMYLLTVSPSSSKP